MSGQALALVLTAAVLHALWNLAAKRVEVDGVSFVWLYVAGSAVIWVPVAAIWVALAHEHPRWSWLYAAALTATFHIVYQLVLQTGLPAGGPQRGLPGGPRGRSDDHLRVAVSVLGERPHPSPWSACSPSSGACW